MGPNNLLDVRITPAWAGKRAWRPGSSQRGRDHPRVGGEKGVQRKKLAFGKGSPPHGRGKESVFRHQCRQYRITPAWAGKSRCGSSASPRGWDHPRMGGEKSLGFIPSQIRRGSPPHGRGKDHTGDKAACLDRITPAWAGKRLVSLRFRFFLRDHPRVGGEKNITTEEQAAQIGSPPRRRGKGSRCKHRPLPDRITPA